MRFLQARFPLSISRTSVRVALVGALGLAIAGCAGKADDYSQLAFEEPDPADAIYNEGLSLLNQGKLGKAADKFQEVDKSHPYSDWARRSLIMSAYSSYKIGDFDSTVNSAKRYVALYPTSEDAAYAQYLIGESYFRQIPDITRDQAMAERALGAMDEVVRKYPESEYANDALAKTRVARDQLAGQEMMVGRYYMERKNYSGALGRFKTVVNDYQTTRHVEEGLYRLVETYMSMGIVSEAQTAAAVLGHNYPNSEWYKDAYALLDSGGYQPQRNNRSWISRAFDAAVPG